MPSRRTLLALSLLPAVCVLPGGLLPAAVTAKTLAKDSEPWSKRIRSVADEALEPLFDNAFIVAMTTGRLDKDAFVWYMQQNLVRLEHAEGTVRILQRRFMTKRHKSFCEDWINDIRSMQAWSKDMLQMSTGGDKAAAAPATGTFPRLAVGGTFDDLRADPAVRNQLRFERNAANRLHLAVALAAVASYWVTSERLSTWMNERMTLRGNVYDIHMESLSDVSLKTRAGLILQLADELAAQESPRIAQEMTACFLEGCSGEIAVYRAASTLLQ